VGTEMASEKNQTKSYEFSQQLEVKLAYIDKEDKTFYHSWGD
jgi:hypothetical protein